MRRSRLKTFLLYFAPQFSGYTKFGIDPTEQPVLRISTHKRQDQVVLVVEDDGIGIAASDLPRIFEKGFTGQNGRMVQQSTGIGLYLCKRLCEKLGIGITAESSEHGTAISLSFHINCLIHEVQS